MEVALAAVEGGRSVTVFSLGFRFGGGAASPDVGWGHVLST